MDKNDIIEDAEWTEVNPEPNAEQNTQQEEAEQKINMTLIGQKKAKKRSKPGLSKLAKQSNMLLKKAKTIPKLNNLAKKSKLPLIKLEKISQISLINLSTFTKGFC